MIVRDLGLVAYGDALALQQDLVSRVAAGEEDTLLLLEHRPVITLGRNAGRGHLHVSDEELARRGIELHKTTRGGDITCHFPGQLVAYPVFRLAKRPGGVRRFFTDLEQIIIDTLSRFEVRAERREGLPGVWTGRGKIASIGIAVRRWVSYHGLALNVGPDLSLFELVTLCGLQGASATSVARERGDKAVSIQDMKDAIEHEFRKAFAHSQVAPG